MLPYTPLHHLLMDAVGRPVVCTSGNLAEEPMATTVEEVFARLSGVFDAVLTHDRPIVRPVDDSVAQLGPDGLRVLRRARGYAPQPIALGRQVPAVLAVGGHLKNVVSLTLGDQAVLGAHVGDLDNVEALAVHQRAIRDLVEFFHAEPEAVACDLHPDYASTRTAESLAAAWDVPLVRVQHHHAHVAACMAEHGLEGPVLGLSWDGTGYGPDGTAWGGEALLCERAEFIRVAHLRSFGLPGGDKAAREPRRAALGALWEIDPDAALGQARTWFTPAELAPLAALLAHGRQVPRTTSIGRLFDAVAALVGLAPRISFEGQAAMALEFAADEGCDESYPLPLTDAAPAVIDFAPLLRAVLADVAAGVPRGRIAGRFHNALAEMAVAVARRAGCGQVALGGGCFQNVLLATRVRKRLGDAGFSVYLPREVPPGDGGIALGQLFIAVHQLKETSHVPGNTR
jgi:hydrogenase maturation protein HypF